MEVEEEEVELEPDHETTEGYYLHQTEMAFLTVNGAVAEVEVEVGERLGPEMAQEEEVEEEQDNSLQLSISTLRASEPDEARSESSPGCHPA